MEARKVIAKIIVGIMAAACYQPEPRPETAADWTVTRVFAGQQDGQVTLSWADPAVNGLFWYLDGKHTRTYNKNMTDPAWYPFTKDSAFYIIMNMGVGRSTDAYPGGAGDGFYAHMDVDYVKVTANNDTVLRDCPYYK